MAQEKFQSSPYPPPVAMPPPSRPASTSSPSSSHSSGRKRKRDESAHPSQRSSRLSSTTTDLANETATRIERESDTFSETTKRRVELTAGSKCLHCDATPVEICHVVPRRDSAYSDLHEQGFFAFRLSQECNAVPLCPTCHTNFDDFSNPGFIFLPRNLDYFIEYEERDWERREDLARTGVENGGPRKIPNEEEYAEQGSLYDCYTLRGFLGRYSTIRQGSVHEVTWPGAPAASLRRAFMLFAHFHLINVLPEGVEEKLRRLFELYRRRMLPFGIPATGQESEALQTLPQEADGAQDDTANSRDTIDQPIASSERITPRATVSRQSGEGAREMADSDHAVPSLGHASSPISLSMPSMQHIKRGSARKRYIHMKHKVQDVFFNFGPECTAQSNIALYLDSLKSSDRLIAS